jgi:hypothetical protein
MDGSRYAIEWEMLGTITGASGGFPATGKPYRIRGASIGELGPDSKYRELGLRNLAACLIDVGLLQVPPA